MPIPTAPLWLSALLVLLTAVLAGGWVFGLRHALLGLNVHGQPRIRALNRTASGLLVWLAVTAFAADLGFFQNFEELPPRLLMVILVPAAFCIWFAAVGCTTPLLRQIPAHWLIHAQAFRIGMELLLWAAVQVGALPALVSWEGRNWDVLTGLAALVVGERVRRQGLGRNRGWVLGFHLLGLGLLINVVVHAQLAAPTPFRQLVVEPSTALVSTWPWIWLPTFIVPSALLLHLLGLRQLRDPRRGGTPPG